eukprot:6181284-Pleurochrysis_carterae.AAC.1
MLPRRGRRNRPGSRSSTAIPPVAPPARAARYCAHPGGAGEMPAGCARVRTGGWCATEKDAQGGAAKTTSNCPPRTHPKMVFATSSLVRSWSAPPTAVSM